MAVVKVKMVKAALVRSAPQTATTGRVYDSREWDMKVAAPEEMPQELAKEMAACIEKAFPSEFLPAVGLIVDEGRNATLEYGDYKLTVTFREDSVYSV